jgi:serine/threonine protein kinase
LDVVGVLSRIRHPNIVRFLGSGKSPRKFLVLELLSGGSLSHALGLRSDSRNQTWERRFSFLETLDFALSLAQALKYLHHDWSPSVHIIHRDLKPDNIGFAADGRVKLFDFGLCASVRAQRERTEQYRLTGNTGTLRYMAPEVVLGRSYHHSVDVYSFGILIWQVASGKVPFRDMGKKTYFDRVVVGGQRPRIDTRWPLAFAHLLRQCWHEDKHARPSFVTIVHELELLVKQEESLVLSQHKKLHRRFIRSCVWCFTRFRPVLFFVLLAVFCTSLWMVVDEDDTVLGAVLGALSTFGIYAILMSYLAVWPSTSLSLTGTASKYKSVGDGDIEEKIELQQRMRALTANAKFIRPSEVTASNCTSPLPSTHSNGSIHISSKRTSSTASKFPSVPSSTGIIELQQIEVRSAPDIGRSMSIEEVTVDYRNGNSNVDNNGSTSFNRANGTSISLSAPNVV